MPANDILNPTAGFDAALGDSMNPNYGFERKRPTTQLRKKAVGGTPWTREIQNAGHVFTLSWLGRTLACVQRLKQYYEQYEDGVFTLVDWDGGGRHYVGRFTTEVSPVETSNNKWDVQNVTFEEIPRQTMLQYPSDWDHDSILYLPYNDFGDQKLATSGTWAQAALGIAAPHITLGGTDRQALLPTTVQQNIGTTAGDWATFEYRGYGFKLWMLTGPNCGKCDVYLDGTLIQTVDLYAAAAAVSAVLVQANTPLDIHDLQVVVDDTKNAASSGFLVQWYALQVMR